MIVSRKRLICAVLVFLFIAAGVFPGPTMSGAMFPENYEVRLKYRDLIFGPRNDLLSFKPVEVDQVSEDLSVSMQIQEQNDSLYLIFTNEERGEYPLYSRGSYIIRRNSETGNFTQVKIFIRTEPESFVRIHPAGKRSVMDVYLLGTLLYKGVVLPVPIEQIVVEPFSKILELTRFQIGWELLLPQEQRPVDVVTLSMIEALRSELGNLRDSDDGAIDEDGRYRDIDDLALNPE